MKCPTCGKELAPGAKFCTGCGNALPAPTYAAPAAPVAPGAPVAPMGAPVGAPPVAPTGMPPYSAAPAGYPPGYAPVKPVIPGKGLGIAGMVLGIISVVFVCFSYLVFPIIIAIVGCVLSGVGLKKAKDAGMKNGMATAGLVCSCISLGLNIIGLIAGLALGGSLLEAIF